MAQKHVYLLERSLDVGLWVTVGIFTSRAKAEELLKRLPKKYSFILSQLPLNTKLAKGPSCEDQLGLFEHWHYGTCESDYSFVSEDGEYVENGRAKKLLWRDEIQKVIWKKVSPEQD